jgi:hypothetical protein
VFSVGGTGTFSWLGSVSQSSDSPRYCRSPYFNLASGERHDLSPWLRCERAGACRGESLARNRTIPGRAGRLRPKSSRAIGSRYMRRVLHHGASNSRSECNQAVDSAHNLDPDLALGAFLWCGACSELSLPKKLSAKIGTSCDVPSWPDGENRRGCDHVGCPK